MASVLMNEEVTDSWWLTDEAVGGSVPICFRLVRPVHLHADVVGLVLTKRRQACPQLGKMQRCDLLIKILW